MSNALIEGDVLILEGAGERHVYRIKAFDRVPAILAGQGLSEAPITFNIRTIAKMNRIQRVLGEGWEAMAIGKFVLLHNHIDPRGILLGR